jgi:hypothetical protein
MLLRFPTRPARSRAPQKYRARLSVEVLESRLAPTTSPGPIPPAPVNDLGPGPHGIAVDAAGNSVAVWASYNSDGSGWDVYGQRFDEFGLPLGDEFQVNTTENGDQQYAGVAMDDSGSFVVTWTSNEQDGSGWGVYARRYDAAGAPRTGEFLVNTTTAGDQLYPSLDMSGTGSFIITWASDELDPDGWDIYARRYSAAATPEGDEFRVNGLTDLAQTRPDVAMDLSGNFVVVWQGERAPGTTDVFARRFDGLGTAQGDDFRVNASVAGSAQQGRVAMDGSGNFVVTWTQLDACDGTWNIFAQRYSAAGAALGAALVVTAMPQFGSPSAGSIAMDAAGNFFITWIQSDLLGGATVVGREYDANGLAVGAEFQIDTIASGAQSCTAVAMNATGDAVVLWNDAGTAGEDGLFVQEYFDLTTTSEGSTETTDAAFIAMYS